MIERIPSWSVWQPLSSIGRSELLLTLPGLYRIRRMGQVHLDYLGQTGRPLRRRLKELSGIYGPQMPYRDPHTAGPGLWSLLHQGGNALEFSVAAVAGDERYRKAMEAAAISLHRQQFGFSPTVNFGRMPPGYQMSSALKQGRRGGLTQQVETCHQAGTAPQIDLANWGKPEQGYSWTWIPLVQIKRAVPADVTGLYLIRHGKTGDLLYIGQGRLRDRLRGHSEKASSTFQGHLFQNADTEAAWTVLSGTTSNQLQELENDLIASYFLTTGQIPVAQFMGEQSRQSGSKTGQVRSSR